MESSSTSRSTRYFSTVKIYLFLMYFFACYLLRIVWYICIIAFCSFFFPIADDVLRHNFACFIQFWHVFAFLFLLSFFFNFLRSSMEPGKYWGVWKASRWTVRCNTSIRYLHTYIIWSLHLCICAADILATLIAFIYLIYLCVSVVWRTRERTDESIWFWLESDKAYATKQDDHTVDGRLQYA